MRDINRIKPLLSKFQELWESSPDLRFGQFVEIIKNEIKTDDLFYVEDNLIENAIDNLLEKDNLNRKESTIKYDCGKSKCLCHTCKNSLQINSYNTSCWCDRDKNQDKVKFDVTTPCHEDGLSECPYYQGR